MDLIISNDFTMTVTSWLLTYAIHSTVLLGAAWAVSRALGEKRLAVQELVWRAALVGALITATLPSVLGASPLDGVLEAVGTTAPLPAAPATLAPGVAPQQLSSLAVGAGPSPGWLSALALAWLLGAGLCLVRLGRAHGDLRRLLRDRRRLPLPAVVARLARTMGVRRVALSTSKAITVPFATGLVHPEVCCPERMLNGLEPARRNGLLAHELAHIARRDPAWRLLYRLTEGVLFFQPLNRLGRARLEELSELASDELAVRCTGNHIGLAHSLLDVAGWSGCTQAPIPATAAVSGRAGVARRVERLLAGGARPAAPPRWATLLLAGVVGLSALLLPSVTLRAAVAGGVMDGVVLAVEAPAPSPPSEPPAAAAPPAPVEAPTNAQPAPAASPSPAASPAPAAPPEPAAPALDDLQEHLQQMGQRLQEQMHDLVARQYELQEQMSPTEEQIWAIEERARELAERLQPSDEQMRELEKHVRELAERIQPSEEDIRRLEAEALVMAEQGHISEEEMDELRARAREMAARARPSEEELRQIREQARELGERARPSSEDIRRLKEEARALARQMQPLQEQMRRLAEEARRLALETAPTREEMKRLAAEARAQARELAEQVRRQEAEVEGRARQLEEQARRQVEQEQQQADQPTPHDPQH